MAQTKDHSIEYLESNYDSNAQSRYPHLSRDDLETILYLLTTKTSASKRVMIGFLRLGFVLGALPLVAGAIAFIVHVFNGWKLEDAGFIAFILVVISAGFFGTCYAIGWVLSAFFSDKSTL